MNPDESYYDGIPPEYFSMSLDEIEAAIREEENRINCVDSKADEKSTH